MVSRLVSQTFDTTPVTHGMTISAWRVRSEAVGEILVHVWDFGGQQIFHGVDELFFGSSAAYLIVVNGRDEVNADAEMWLNLAVRFAPDAPFIVAVTRSDVRATPVNGEGLRRSIRTSGRSSPRRRFRAPASAS